MPLHAPTRPSELIRQFKLAHGAYPIPEAIRAAIEPKEQDLLITRLQGKVKTLNAVNHNRLVIVIEGIVKLMVKAAKRGS